MAAKSNPQSKAKRSHNQAVNSEEGLWQTNFGAWLEKNGCSYKGVTGDNAYPIEYYIDLNKLKSAILELTLSQENAVSYFSVRKLHEDERAQDGEFWLHVGVPGDYAIRQERVTDLLSTDSDTKSRQAEAQ